MVFNGLPRDKIALFAVLEEYLRDFGFKALPNLNQFRRISRLGFHSLYVTPNFNKKEIVIDLKLGNRMHLVEETMFQFTNGFSSFSAHAATTITSLTQVDSNFQSVYFIENKHDFKRLFQNVKLFMETSGLEYFGFIDDLIFLDTIYNAKPHAPCTLQFNQINRAFRGITIAKLAQNCSFDALLNTYLQELIKLGAPKQTIHRFTLLSNHLQLNSFN